MIYSQFILFTCLVVISTSFNENEVVNMIDFNDKQFMTLEKEQTYKIISKIDKTNYFCIRKDDLEAHKNYDIKVTYKSNDGIDIPIHEIERQDLKEMYQTKKQLRKLDTVIFQFLTGADGFVMDDHWIFKTSYKKDYCFQLTPFFSTKTHKASSIISYNIKYEKIVVSYIPNYVIQQVILFALLSYLIMKFIKSEQGSQWIIQYLQIPEDQSNKL